MEIHEPPTFTPDTQTRKRKIHCKQELIIQSLQRFYATRDDIEEIVELLKGTSEMSLRLIDWFVTNYAKAHTTSYVLNGQEFVVYLNYKNQLKAYSKKLFDPFCRRERISFQIPGHEPFLTTVGKLNFFRWAIEKKILEFIKSHQANIEKEMNLAMKEQAKQRSNDNSRSTDASGVTTNSSASTRKRSTHKDTTVLKMIQKQEEPIIISFS